MVHEKWFLFKNIPLMNEGKLSYSFVALCANVVRGNITFWNNNDNFVCKVYWDKINKIFPNRRRRQCGVAHSCLPFSQFLANNNKLNITCSRPRSRLSLAPESLFNNDFRLLVIFIVTEQHLYVGHRKLITTTCSNGLNTKSLNKREKIVLLLFYRLNRSVFPFLLLLLFIYIFYCEFENCEHAR